MNELIAFLNRKHNITLKDEDGNVIRIKLSKGITDNEICNFEKQNNICFPINYKNLLIYSNGLDYYGYKILSLNEIIIINEKKIFTFHDWGNGDFDCISFGNTYKKGSIYFLSKSASNTFYLIDEILSWFQKTFEEIKQKGTVLHPMDYHNRNENGLYYKVFKDYYEDLYE